MYRMSGQTFYLSTNNVDLFCLWDFRQTRHTHDVAGNSHDHLCTAINDKIPDSNIEILSCTHLLGVLAERELRLGNADREAVHPPCVDTGKFLFPPIS